MSLIFLFCFLEWEVLIDWLVGFFLSFPFYHHVLFYSVVVYISDTLLLLFCLRAIDQIQKFANMNGWVPRSKKNSGMDMIMLSLFNARERERADWEQIFAEADPRFKDVKVWVPEGATLAIIEAVWAG